VPHFGHLPRINTQFSCDEYLSENYSDGTEDVIFVGTLVWL